MWSEHAWNVRVEGGGVAVAEAGDATVAPCTLRLQVLKVSSSGSHKFKVRGLRASRNTVPLLDQRAFE